MKRLLAFFTLGFLFIWGCSSTTGPQNPNGTGQIKMYMIDSPANLDSVVIGVSKVEVHQAGMDTLSGWVTLNNKLRYFDLLELTNGADTILDDTTLAAGKYTQIRLTLANSNYVIDTNGIKIPLFVPSGLQTGIKLTHQFTIEANTLYELTLDFNAESSIIVNGTLNYELKPTIRVVAKITSGTISGTVSPATATSSAWTVNGEDTISTTTNDQGFFKLMALPEGTYEVHLVPENTQYSDTTITNVSVSAGQNTDLGGITLH